MSRSMPSMMQLDTEGVFWCIEDSRNIRTIASARQESQSVQSKGHEADVPLDGRVCGCNRGEPFVREHMMALSDRSTNRVEVVIVCLSLSRGEQSIAHISMPRQSEGPDSSCRPTACLHDVNWPCRHPPQNHSDGP
jgi:hypothetical protein